MLLLVLVALVDAGIYRDDWSLGMSGYWRAVLGAVCLTEGESYRPLAPCCLLTSTSPVPAAWTRTRFTLHLRSKISSQPCNFTLVTEEVVPEWTQPGKPSYHKRI